MKAKMNTSKKEFEEMKKLAFDTIIKAGKIVERYFYKELKIFEKESGDYVTKADIETEKHIISRIKKKFPDAKIIAEESGKHGKPEKDEYFWLIDPIDGTRNFVYGFPEFFVMIGIAKNNEAVFIANYHPITKRLYWAEKGKGAYLGTKKIHVSGVRNMKDAKCGIGIERDFKNSKKCLLLYNHAFFFMKNIIHTACIAAKITAMASGKIDANITNLFLQHDSGPLVLLLEEAGGKVTTLDGKRANLGTPKNSIVVYSNGKLHGKLLDYAKNL